MFDNPQNEVNTMSKKLRPPKMSDEEFELFYKEIYAEFGPKPVAPVEPEIQEEVIEEEPVAEIEPEVQEEEEDFQAALEAEIEAEATQAIQEEAAKAAAVIRHVQEDEVIDTNTNGVKLVKPKKEKGVGGLVVIICLELLAIAAVAGYWMVHIL